MKGNPEERAVALGQYVAETGATVRNAAMRFGKMCIRDRYWNSGWSGSFHHFLGIIAVEFFLAQLVEILHNGKIRGLFYAVVGAVGDTEPGIQLGEQDFNGVDLRIRKIFVRPEKVF